ncbi:MAG: hypothetical protein JW883_11510 [Deltaproteobacteria bacterium]|nr:hypothetical protein [Deltaproteobacteria bacterium]
MGTDLASNSKTLLYLRPIWRSANDDFSETWNHLLELKEDFWGGRIETESVHPDRSVVLVFDEVTAALTIANNIREFVSKTLSHDKEPGISPVQMVIDSGPYLKADEIVVEDLGVNWEEIDPGEIYVSASAHTLMESNEIPSHGLQSGSDSLNSLYKLIPQNNMGTGAPPLFSSHNGLTQGKNHPCYYCGDKKHLATNCPSKHLPLTTHALNMLGYLSFDRINRLFSEYVAGGKQSIDPDKESQTDTDSSHNLAFCGFYDLKRVFQLRFFRNIWNSADHSWDEIRKTTVKKKEKGGFMWVGTDCLRVSNLAQAETFLETSLEEHPDDYRPHCALGFLNVEKSDFLTARYHFVKALDCAETKPQKIFILLLIARLYDLEDYPSEAAENIRDILIIDPHCVEAIYYDVIFKLRAGKESEALSQLVKLINQDREYYINALIDPDLAPFSAVVHPELKDIFDGAKDEALGIFHKAEKEYDKLERILDEKEIVEAASLWSDIKELSEKDGYFAYLDIVHYGKFLISMSRRSIEEKRNEIFEALHGLTRRVEKYLVFASNYRYRSLISGPYQKLARVQTKIAHTRDMARSDVPEEFRRSPDRLGELGDELDQIQSKLKRLEAVQLVILFLTRFVKKSLVFQAAIVFLAIIVFPVAVYYANFVLPKYKISPVQNIWSYQLGILIAGGICAGLLALIRTIKSLHKEQGQLL